MPKKIEFTSEDIKEMERMYLEEAKNGQEIGKKFNCCGTTIQNILKNNGKLMSNSERRKFIYSRIPKDNPIVLCACGCGESRLKYIVENGHIRTDRPIRFIVGHQFKKIDKTAKILCKCGCGQERFLYNKQGTKGEYIKGHYSRKGKSKYDKTLMIPCACGCGKMICKFNKKGRERKMIKGHWTKQMREQATKRMEGEKNPFYGNHQFAGDKNPFYGKHHDEKTIELMSNLKIGVVSHNKGKAKENYEPLRKASEKISKFRSGKTWEELYGKEEAERLRKLDSERMMGEKNPFYNKNHTLEVRKLMSAKKQDIDIDCWQNFISFEPYTPEFNKAFKEAIRIRDAFLCTKCGMREEDSIVLLKRKLTCHHVDYDKKNTRKENCCALCTRCNFEVNTNRPHWTKFFQSLLSERFGYKYSEDGKIILELNHE